MRYAWLLLFVTSTAYADSIEEARALDQQGARAYQQGRYRDAIRYFHEAYDRGGPSTELWNIAKCHLKIDEPEQADEALSQFLERKDITPEDRRDAEKLRKDIATRPSVLTVISNPSGATVDVDGRIIGTTPITIDVPPGEHRVFIKGEGLGPREEIVDARFGRALIVTTDLDRPSPNGPSAPRPRRLAIEIGFGPSFPRYGDVGGTGLPHGYASGSYALVTWRSILAGASFRFGLWGDTWSGASTAAGCMLPSSYSAAEIAGHVLGFFGTNIGRVRLGAEAGAGIAGTITSSAIGGDVYDPSCTSSHSVQPAFHGSLDASYRVLPWLRVVVRPFEIDLHPAYEGARTAAKGAWMRIGLSAGAAFDL